MRKYYDDFNEEYERGYEAGRRTAMRDLDESYDLDLTIKFIYVNVQLQLGRNLDDFIRKD